MTQHPNPDPGDPASPPADAEDAPLARLPRRAQIAVMRRVAAAALAAYDLPPARLTLVAHAWNTVFRVDTPGARHALRITRTGLPTIDTVASELAWLAAIRRDTPLSVPAPVPARDGALLAVAGAPGVPQPYICILCGWLPGRRMRRHVTPAQMERVGILMARLQNHSAGWTRPPGFRRGRADWPIAAGRWLPDPFAPEILAAIHAGIAARLSPAEAGQVTAALTRIRAVDQALGRGPDAFGLIHADLHYHNLLFDGATVRALDFDDCGFAPWLFDPAVMLSEVLDWPDYPALRAALLAGYRRARPLSAAHEAYLDTFIALRQLQDVLDLLDLPAAAFTAASAARIRQSLATLPALLPPGAP